MHQCLLKSHLSCLAIYIYFVLNSAQFSGEKNFFLRFIIHGQGSSEKGFKILNCETEIYLIAVISCLHTSN